MRFSSYARGARVAALAASLVLVSILAAACGPAVGPSGGSGVPSRSDRRDR